MIRWGLAGTGDIANKRVAPALASEPRSRLIAVADIRLERAQALAERFGAEKVYSSLDDLLADDEIDALYLATPIFLHAPQTIQALRAGKHVLVEKPMALTLAEGEEMVATANEMGCTLGVAYFRRFYPKIARVRDLLERNTLGDVVQVVSIYHTWYNPAPHDPKAWRVQKERAGGGVLWDMGSHRFDLLVGLFGVPRQLFARNDTLTHGYQVEDTSSVFFIFPNGAHCVSAWNWNSRTWIDHLSIIGTLGKVVLEPMDSPRLTLIIGGDRRQDTYEEEIPLPENVHLPMIEDFVSALEEGRSPLESGEEGLKTNRILAAIEESTRSGKMVAV